MLLREWTGSRCRCCRTRGPIDRRRLQWPARARHGSLNHDLLQGPAVLPGRLGPEIVKAEPAGQFPSGVVPLPAPLAVVAGAGGVAQPSQQSAGAGELVTNPGWHDRIASGHRQPRQRVGQLPGAPFSFFQHRCGLRPARRSVEATFDGRVSLHIGWPRCLAQVGEAVIKPSAVVSAGEPMPGGEQVGIRLLEGLLLVDEHLQSEAGVQLGVVEAAPSERPVLVVFHQVVIGIAGTGQVVEAQRVHRRQVQQPEVGVGSFQVGQSKSIRLWPSRKSAPWASSSSLASATGSPRRRANVKDPPVSGRTPARAWMRPSFRPTSRSRDSQRDRG